VEESLEERIHFEIMGKEWLLTKW